MPRRRPAERPPRMRLRPSPSHFMFSGTMATVPCHPDRRHLPAPGPTVLSAHVARGVLLRSMAFEDDEELAREGDEYGLRCLALLTQANAHKDEAGDASRGSKGCNVERLADFAATAQIRRTPR